MKKNFAQRGGLFPQPVMIIGTYNAEGKPNAMNAAWVTMRGMDTIELVLSSHASTDNLAAQRAFTIAPADKKNLVAADYVGIDSARKTPNKAEKSGLTFVKSENVNAPVIEQFPVTMECEVLSIEDYNGESIVLGKIVNTLVEEDALDEKGTVDFDELGLIVYDPSHRSYHDLGKETAGAWNIGKQLM